MARRPVFFPVLTGAPYVGMRVLDFEWYPGFAKTQAQKSIASLHRAAELIGLKPVLEISSKSHQKLGVMISAFNLSVKLYGRTMSVESAFQGSKVFQNGGPFHDLYQVPGKQAKKDARLRSSGELVGFNLLGKEWPIEPKTAFYDWIYINALYQHPELADQVLSFAAFTDIAFSPQKSLNCQARSAALFVALARRGDLQKVVSGEEAYLEVLNGETKRLNGGFTQTHLFEDDQ